MTRDWAMAYGVGDAFGVAVKVVEADGGGIQVSGVNPDYTDGGSSLFAHTICCDTLIP